MRYKIGGVPYHYAWLNGYLDNRPTLLCLHGFTGTSNTFFKLAQSLSTYNVLAIDLIGHGQTSSVAHPSRYEMPSLNKDLVTLCHHLNLTKVALLGYSMGGRVALGFSLTYPELISQLILVSSSPGLETATERAKRQRADQQLAQKLLNNPIEDFVKYWENLPLFASQASLSHEEQARIRTERLSQNKLGLALSLLKMGTGQQTNFWPMLQTLENIPTLLVTGEKDKKFCDIAKKMQQTQNTFDYLEFPHAGHAVYLEQATNFNDRVKRWLKGESEIED